MQNSPRQIRIEQLLRQRDSLLNFIESIDRISIARGFMTTRDATLMYFAKSKLHIVASQCVANICLREIEEKFTEKEITE